MTPRSILVVTDFSELGGHALARAALLGAEHRAALQLVYLSAPGEVPPPMWRFACRTMRCSFASVTRSLCRPYRAWIARWQTSPARQPRTT